MGYGKKPGNAEVNRFWGGQRLYIVLCASSVIPAKAGNQERL